MANGMNIERYLQVPYQDFGRDLAGWDCWGLVRHVLHHDFGQPLFAAFGTIHPHDLNNLNIAFKQSLNQFKPTNAEPGAVACLFRFGVLVHVGVCIDSTDILHTTQSSGTALISHRQFKRLGLHTEFYRYDPHFQQ